MKFVFNPFTGKFDFTEVSADKYVAIDAAATPGYLGAAYNDGVLRTSSPITYTDNGNYITLGVDETAINHNNLTGKQGGAVGEYYHLSAAELASLHVAVTVAGAPLTLSGQEITFNYDTNDFQLSGNNLQVKDSGIDHTGIANIGTNTHAQIDTHIANSAIHFTEGSIDHGSIGGLTDVADHPGYVTLDGTRPLTANWDAGSFEIRAQTFQSDVATGTAPFTVASTTVVTNLNVDKLDGYDAVSFSILGEDTVTTTGNIDDYDFGTASIIRMNNSSLSTIRGLKAGVAGQRLTIISVGSAQVDINDEDANSTAANRIITSCSATISLYQGKGSVSLMYDATTARWRVEDHNQGDYIAYTPVMTTYPSDSITLGNGTIIGYYLRKKHEIHFRIKFVYGSTTSISGAGAFLFTLPFTSNTTNWKSDNANIFNSILHDDTVGQYVAEGVQLNTTQVFVIPLGGVNGATKTYPFSIATDDQVAVDGIYTAA